MILWLLGPGLLMFQLDWNSILSTNSLRTILTNYADWKGLGLLLLWAEWRLFFPSFFFNPVKKLSLGPGNWETGNKLQVMMELFQSCRCPQRALSSLSETKWNQLPASRLQQKLPGFIAFLNMATCLPPQTGHKGKRLFLMQKLLLHATPVTPVKARLGPAIWGPVDTHVPCEHVCRKAVQATLEMGRAGWVG